MTPLSVVVPVFNEAAILPEFLAHLRERAPATTRAEIIVVDGGSDDGSYELARELAGPLALRVLRCATRGRAWQMNAGAEVASGAALWFLHADS